MLAPSPVVVSPASSNLLFHFVFLMHIPDDLPIKFCICVRGFIFTFPNSFFPAETCPWLGRSATQHCLGAAFQMKFFAASP